MRGLSRLFLASTLLTISIGAGLFLSSGPALRGQATPSPFHIFLFAQGQLEFPQEPISDNLVDLSINTSFTITSSTNETVNFYFYVPSTHWGDGKVPLENGMRLSINGRDYPPFVGDGEDWSNAWQINLHALKASPPSPPCSEVSPCLEAIVPLSGIGGTPGIHEIRVTADDGVSQAIGVFTWTVLPERSDSSASSQEITPSSSSSFLQPEKSSSSQVNLLPPLLPPLPTSSSSSSEASVGIPSPPPPPSSLSSSSAPPLLPPLPPEWSSSSQLTLLPPFHPSPPPPPSPPAPPPSFPPPSFPSFSSFSSKRLESSSRTSLSSISSPSSSKTSSSTPSSLSPPSPPPSAPPDRPVLLPKLPSPSSAACCMSLVDGSTFFVQHQPSLLRKLWANAKEILEVVLDLFYDVELNNPCGGDAVEVENALCIAGDNDGQQGGVQGPQQPLCGDAIVTRPEEDCDPAALNLFDRLCFANNPNLANPDNALPFWLCPSVAAPGGGAACKCDVAPSLSSSTASAVSAASSTSSCGGFAPDVAACRNGSCPPGQRCALIPAHTDPLYSDFDECGCVSSTSPPPSVPPRRPLPPQFPQKKIPQFCCGKSSIWTTCGGPHSIGNSSSWMAGVPERERRYYYSCFDICNVLFGPGTLLSSFCRRNLVYDNLAECNRVCFQASIDENARVCRKSNISSAGQGNPVMCSFSAGGGEDGTWSSSSASAGGSLQSASSPSSRSFPASSLSPPPSPVSSMESFPDSSRGTAVSPPWGGSDGKDGGGDVVIYWSASSALPSSIGAGGSEDDGGKEWPRISSGGFSSAHTDVSTGSSALWSSSHSSSISPASRSSFATSSAPFVSSVHFSSSSASSRAPLSPSSSPFFSFSSFSSPPLSSVSAVPTDSSAPSASSAVSVAFLPPIEILRQLPPELLADVIFQLPPQEAAALLAQFTAQQRQELLQAMPPERRSKLFALTAPPACGNGKMEEGEQCEPELHSPDSPLLCLRCRLVSQLCGDGKTDPGEECDDGVGNTMTPNTRCRPDCGYARCGDGVLDSLLEQCDDSNRLSGDGCDGSCRGEAPSLLSPTFAFPPSSQLPASSPPSLAPRLARRPLQQTTETGPELLAIMAAGAAGGWAWMRRRRTIPPLPHIAR